jgi:hypothetical protein
MPRPIEPGYPFPSRSIYDPHVGIQPQRRIQWNALRERALTNPDEFLGAIHPPVPKTGAQNTGRLPLLETFTPNEQAQLRNLAATKLRQQTTLDLKRLQNIEPTADPWKLLGETRQLNRQVELVRVELNDASLQPQVKALQGTAARRCLEVSLEESAALAEQGRWPEAGRNATSRLRELGEVPVETAALRRFAEIQQRAEALDCVANILSRPEAAPPETAQLSPLPETLTKPVNDYVKLNRLRAEAEDQWAKAPNVSDLRQGLEVLGGSPESRPLANRLGNELAVKAFLKGHTKEANALLDAAQSFGTGKPLTPKEQAAKLSLLRDMKALVLGEEGGKVQSWPAADALQGQSVEGNPPARGPPPGARPLLPEGDAKGWRPPVVERATEGLPTPAGALDPPIQAQRKTIETEARRQSQTLEQDRASTLLTSRPSRAAYIVAQAIVPLPLPVPAVLPTLPQAKPAILPAAVDDEDEKAIAAIEKELGRKLTPQEKMTVKRLRRNGSGFKAILNDLVAAALPIDP